MKAETTVDAILEWTYELSNPLADAIVDAIAEAAVFLLDLCGVELPSFSGLGCYGM